jgi:peptide/nickel transport system permease protein
MAEGSALNQTLASTDIGTGSAGRYGRWIVRRVALGVVTLVAVSLVIFAATQALPSDPARAVLGRTATPASLAELRHELGLDKPLVTQYTHWFGGVLSGDLGTSIQTRGPVSDVISNRIGNSLVLLFLVAIIALPLSFALGVLTAIRRGPIDRGLLLISIGLAGLPEFVIGIVLVILFATTAFQWLPAVAAIPPGESPFAHTSSLVLPVATLVLVMVPYLYRLVRAAMLDVLSSEYIAMARLKGMPNRRVVVRHGLRNALLPAIQGSALVMGWLLGGVVVVENVFQYPGLGSSLADAIQNRDVQVIQAIVLIFAVGIIVFNLVADVLTVLVTPKLRTGGSL